jgi:hypothetical protein
LLGVILPIGGEPQDATLFDFGVEQGNEFAVEQAALVVSLFVPRIGKEDEHLIEARIGNGRFQYLHGVMTYHAHIAELCFFGAEQQPTHSRAMHFNAQVVDLGMSLRQGANDFTGAEANFQAAGPLGAGFAPKRSVQIDGRIVEIQAVDRPKLGECSFLRCRNPAGA